MVRVERRLAGSGDAALYIGTPKSGARFSRHERRLGEGQAKRPAN